MNLTGERMARGGGVRPCRWKLVKREVARATEGWWTFALVQNREVRDVPASGNCICWQPQPHANGSGPPCLTFTRVLAIQTLIYVYYYYLSEFRQRFTHLI